MPHRHRLNVEVRALGGRAGLGIVLAAYRTGPERRRHQGQILGPGGAADGVGQQNRRRGVGAALRDADQHIVVATHPHQVVGERQVGQQLPLADNGVQVVDRIARQDGVLGK